MRIDFLSVVLMGLSLAFSAHAAPATPEPTIRLINFSVKNEVAIFEYPNTYKDLSQTSNRVWLLTVFNGAAKTTRIKYMKELVQFDCEDQTETSLSATGFDGDGNAIASSDEKKTSYVSPETTLSMTMHFLCSAERAKPASPYTSFQNIDAAVEFSNFAYEQAKDD